MKALYNSLSYLQVLVAYILQFMLQFMLWKA